MQGFFNVLKPTGVSSAYVVGKIKKLLNVKRVGHMGTLDPAASGVLTIAVGKATRFFDYFLNKDKVYYAIAEFGVQTDTLDSEGEIIKKEKVSIDEELLIKTVKNFVGEISQVPPLYSAINIEGKSATIEPRIVKIYDLQIIDKIDNNKFAFRVHCSSGTYIRSLLFDIAKAMGTIANIPVIIREKSGNFSIFEAVTIEELEKNQSKSLIPIEKQFENLRKIIFSLADEKSVINGVVINNNYGLSDGEEFLGYLQNQKLLGLFACNKQQIKCKIHVYEGD